MDVTNLAGTVNYVISSEVSTGILLGLLVLGAVLFLKSDVYPEFAWEFMSKTIRMPFILADIRDHLQELRLTHEMMTEIQDMMTKLQGLLRDIHSAANGLHEEMEKFVTGNVKELKEFEIRRQAERGDEKPPALGRVDPQPQRPGNTIFR